MIELLSLLCAIYSAVIATLSYRASHKEKTAPKHSKQKKR